MSIVIRSATADDQQLIISLVRGARLNPTRLDWPNFLIAERMDAGSACIVGIGQLRPHAEGILELASLVVAPGEQGQGIGSQLVHALICKADRPLYLMCKDDKIAYYKRFGFVELVDPADVPRAMRSMYRFVRAIRRVVGFFFKKMPYLAIMMYVGPSLAKSYYPR